MGAGKKPVIPPRFERTFVRCCTSEPHVFNLFAGTFLRNRFALALFGPVHVAAPRMKPDPQERAAGDQVSHEPALKNESMVGQDAVTMTLLLLGAIGVQRFMCFHRRF